MTQDKAAWVAGLQRIASQLSALRGSERDLVAIWFARQYNTGGTAITDADVASLNLTAAKVTAMVVALQQFENFMGNSAVTTGDYATSINAVRNDT